MRGHQIKMPNYQTITIISGKKKPQQKLFTQNIYSTYSTALRGVSEELYIYISHYLVNSVKNAPIYNLK